MKRLKLILFSVFLLYFALGIPGPACAQQPDAQPVNPDSTPAARALLKELDRLSGHAILSGEHNYPNTVSQYSNRVYELTGKYPAIFGQDFGFAAGSDKDSTLSRPAMIREVIRQYRAGAIPALCWHAVPPTQDEPVTFQGSILSKLTDWEFEQLLTPGTDLHARWERQVDRIAGYLRELQDAGVPVLFRPYHEMNGNWFWWGGRPGAAGSAALYKMIFDRYVHVHHLNNLIWVWNVAAASSKSQPPEYFWPGPDYVDVVTMDIYRPYTQRDYKSILALAGDRTPMALAEVGTVPTLQVLTEQPRWTYFMIWSEFAEEHNTPETLHTIFNAPGVLSRGDPRLSVPFAAPFVPLAPKDLNATAGARSLLSELLSKKSEILEVDLGSDGRQDLMNELQRATKEGKVPLLRWSPFSPTGGGDVLLDEYTWSQLRTPGTSLNMGWRAQIDLFAVLLRRCPGPVLLSVLPGSNGNAWWSRPGLDGSQVLYREVQQRLIELGIHNVLWVWEPASVSAKYPSSAQVLDEYFPGPLSVDVYLLDSDGSEAEREATLASIRLIASECLLGVRENGSVAPDLPTINLSVSSLPDR